MALKDRLYHTPGTEDAIGIHAIYAAARRYADGDVTDAQVQAAFALTVDEWNALKAIAAAVGAAKLNDVILLAQEGYLTPAQADVLLGL